MNTTSLAPAALVLALLSTAASGQTCLLWEELGGGLAHAPTTPSVWELARFDDGGGEQLYAAGSFSSAGGLPVSNIACWDGTAWSDVGGGVDGQVEALFVHDDDGAGPIAPALYVGGLFTGAGGVSVSNLARWDGTSWADVGGGTNGLVSALAAFDHDGAGPLPAELVAGGAFFTAGGNTTLFAATWNGTSWAALGTGVNNAVTSLCVYDDGTGPDLYAGGYFTHAGLVPSAMISRWDGAGWSIVGGGLVGHPTFTSGVLDLETFDDGTGNALFAVGLIKFAGTSSKDGIAKWTGAHWLDVGAGFQPASPAALHVWDDGDGPALFAGGAFNASGTTALSNVALWDGAGWGPVGIGAGVDKTVLALCDYDDGTGSALIVGGVMTKAGGQTARSIARARPVAGPSTYCSAKPNSAGCIPAVTFSGCPSASDPAPFLLRADQVVNGRRGALYYGFAPAAKPFLGGTLCVAPPRRLIGLPSSGGTLKVLANDCTGVFSLDMNARIQSGANPSLAAGAKVYAQFIYRDLFDPTRIGSTDAVSFTIHP